MNESLKEQLKKIPPDTYLTLKGNYGDAVNPTIEQGKLKSIDWANGTLVLHNTVYDHDETVQLDQITSIDDSRTGSGARGSVQDPDWKQDAKGDWYK